MSALTVGRMRFHINHQKSSKIKLAKSQFMKFKTPDLTSELASLLESKGF